MRLRRLGEALLDLMLPPACAVCGRNLTRAAVGVCAVCRAGLRDGPPLARLLTTPGGSLLACGGRAAGADMVRLVGNWKYHRRHGAAGMALRLVRRAHRLAIARAGAVALLVPIPLAPARRRARGFNQAAILARGLAAAEGSPVADLLVRCRDTPQQARLPAETARRRANVAGAFRAVRPPRGEQPRVGLVDDLVTTGATAGAAAAALRAAGWRVVWVVACGIRIPARESAGGGVP